MEVLWEEDALRPLGEDSRGAGLSILAAAPGSAWPRCASFLYTLAHRRPHTGTRVHTRRKGHDRGHMREPVCRTSFLPSPRQTHPDPAHISAGRHPSLPWASSRPAFVMVRGSTCTLHGDLQHAHVSSPAHLENAQRSTCSHAPSPSVPGPVQGDSPPVTHPLLPQAASLGGHVFPAAPLPSGLSTGSNVMWGRRLGAWAVRSAWLILSSLVHLSLHNLTCLVRPSINRYSDPASLSSSTE